MNRRTFAYLSLAAFGGVFVPRFHRWYRQGSGLLIPTPTAVIEWHWIDPIHDLFPFGTQDEINRIVQQFAHLRRARP